MRAKPRGTPWWVGRSQIEPEGMTAKRRKGAKTSSRILRLLRPHGSVQSARIFSDDLTDEFLPATSDSGESDVADDARFAGLHDQANERVSLHHAGPAAEQQNDAGVGHGRGQPEEIIPIAGDEHLSCACGVDEDFGIGGVAWQHLPQAHDLMPQRFQGKAKFDRDVVVEEKFHRP